MSHPSRVLIVALALAPACLADNPDGFLETESGTSAASASASDTDTATDTSAASDNLLGCDPDQTCNIVLVSQTLNDRVEIFGGRVGDVPAYRGTISIDLKEGTVPGMGLDEPYGMALTDGFLHVVAGHYPQREEGTLLSFPRSFFEGREAGEVIAKDEYFAAGSFMGGVVATAFEETEPIFLLPEPMQDRLLVGIFNNDLFNAETEWDSVGQVAVLDPANPSAFGTVDLPGCTGAGEVIQLADELHAAVACDGNEAVAFLELGTLTGTVVDAAAQINRKVCDLPPQSERRVRHLAHDGVGGVFVGLGPGSTTSDLGAQMWHVNPDCTLDAPVEVGSGGSANMGNIVSFGQNGVLFTSGSKFPDPVRGVFAVTGNLDLCGPVPGFDPYWETDGATINPFGLAVTSDGQHLAVGAGAPTGTPPQDGAFGRVLWATLSGADDPCTMTAEVVDLTDGQPERAPKGDPGDETTYRQAPDVVVIAEVSG